MRIEINEKGGVDFETPIFMNNRQRKIFFDGIKEIFGDIQIHNIEELDRNIGDIKRYPKKWTPDELVYLFSDKSHEEIADILGRKFFSIKSKRAIWLLPFHTWATKNGFVKKGHIEDLKEAIIRYEKWKKE